MLLDYLPRLGRIMLTLLFNCKPSSDARYKNTYLYLQLQTQIKYNIKRIKQQHHTNVHTCRFMEALMFLLC